MNKLYISGPMTGLPNFNRDMFEGVTDQFRSEGMFVVSPHELTTGVDQPDQPWDFYMRGAVKMQMDCDAIAMLPGWTRSRGARREFDLAVDLGMELYLLYVTEQSEGVYANLGRFWTMQAFS